MEPAWESERGTNFRLSQIREKISNNGYNRLPDVFTKEDVIRLGMIILKQLGRKSIG